MNYTETLDYLYRQLPMFQRQGASAFKKDLTNIKRLCTHLMNPQKDFKSIHIAGTNGKGTTAHLLSAAFQKGDYKVGLYTSPHYKDFRERIKINGTYISENHVIDFVQKHKTIFESIQPSFFEITVAMAFDYFSKEKVDIAIIETGLGGRLDSTNIINPVLSVITNISWDHQQFLGDTLDKIATEKAGIIKEKTPIVIGEHQTTDSVFQSIATQRNAPISYAEDTFVLKELPSSLQYSEFHVFKNKISYFENLEVDLKGIYQQKNITTALETIRVYNTLRGVKLISASDISEGFQSIRTLTNYQGRWQILDKNPLVLVDSAHNKAGLSLVIHELQELKYGRLHIVLGVVKDKDLGEILPFFPKEATYYFAKAAIPRGLEAQELQSVAATFDLLGQTYTSVQKAFQSAKQNAHTDDVVFVGGSIFTVAEVL